jgi:hypothetical protein
MTYRWSQQLGATHEPHHFATLDVQQKPAANPKDEDISIFCRIDIVQFAKLTSASSPQRHQLLTPKRSNGPQRYQPVERECLNRLQRHLPVEPERLNGPRPDFDVWFCQNCGDGPYGGWEASCANPNCHYDRR